MRQMRNSLHALAVAAGAVTLGLWVSQAPAQGQVMLPATTEPMNADASVTTTAPPRLTTHETGETQTKIVSIPWVRQAYNSAGSHLARPKITIGNFSQCPALPVGFNPAQFSCFLIHITGGQLIVGHSRQIINRVINLAYAEGADPQGNTVMVFGSMKSRPMPVLGGIFLTPATDSITQTDKNLQLSVHSVGLAVKPDFTGQTAAFISMKIQAINSVFGSGCAVGSRNSPITIDPTFGTTDPPPPNKPISGHVDSAQVIAKELVIIGTTVDNAFAAPRAHDCGPQGALTQVVDEVGALPSPAGTNTAIFQVTVEVTAYSNIDS
jgi:hypothetical protein